MIFTHLSDSSLIAHLKTYDVLLINGCKNQENIINFRKECLNELGRRYDLHKKESI